MARRRMISMELTRSDEFLELPGESQLLYFHLLVEADDDGFITGKKRILGMLGLQPAAFEALAAAGFLIEFPSGAAVVTHWLLCNTIRKERYTPTRFQEEFARLEFVPQQGYVLKTAPKKEKAAPETADGAPGAGKDDCKTAPAPAAEALLAGAPTLPLCDGTEHAVLQREAEEWRKLYPAVDLMQELRNMRGWLLANPARRKPAGAIDRFINAWLSKAQSAPRAAPARKANDLPGPPSYDLERAALKANTTVPVFTKKKRCDPART